ncbi:MAG: nitrate reductase molybdenum cofactor assembly chaperone [Pseudomonadota bacterium]
MASIFKVLSVLLTYPSKEIAAAGADLKKALLDEGLVPDGLQRRLGRLCDELAGRDLIDLQERYVLLFDRSRSLSLHLFEHVHGESRDRGQAMVDLMELYERHGLSIDAKELPDYLPLFLEFLSTLPLDEARVLLAEPLPVITALKERHRKRDSAYAVVFEALEALAAGKAQPAEAATLATPPDEDPDDHAALDQIWEEEAVSFGGAGAMAPDGSCPASRDMLARMTPEPTDPATRRPLNG